MNPLELRGPEFLVFYGMLLGVTFVLALISRWLFSQPGGEPSPAALDLAPFEVAYLQGGGKLAIDAAIARLVHSGMMTINPADRKLLARGEGLPDDYSALERAIDEAARQSGGRPAAAIRAKTTQALEAIHQRLVERELVMPRFRAFVASFFPTLLVAATTLLGVIKIVVGVSRGRPAAYLFLYCLLSIGLVFAFAPPVFRTRRGKRALARLKQTNAALGAQARTRADGLSGHDLALALGLFGTAVLTTGPLLELLPILRPHRTGGADGMGFLSYLPRLGSNCGSRSCSYGSCNTCGGGGCGGGCGGGGCGGCGS